MVWKRLKPLQATALRLLCRTEYGRVQSTLRYRYGLWSRCTGGSVVHGLFLCRSKGVDFRYAAGRNEAPGAGVGVPSIMLLEGIEEGKLELS